MKINVEFNLDWINEDDSIDEAVQRNIIKGIVGGIDDRIKALVQKEADNRLVEKLDVVINNLFSDFMTRNVVITDKWGDEVSRYESVNELLKEKFDNFLVEPVDSKGKALGKNKCGYNEKPRIEYLVAKNIDDKVHEICVKIEKDITSRFAEKMKEAEKTLRLNTVEKYMNKLDFEAGLSSKKGGK